MKDSISIDGIRYTRVPEESSRSEKELFKFKQAMLEICARLEQAEEEALDIYSQMKEGGLSFNSVESEGNLRGIRYARSVFDSMIDGLDLSTTKS